MRNIIIFVSLFGAIILFFGGAVGMLLNVLTMKQAGYTVVAFIVSWGVFLITIFFTKSAEKKSKKKFKNKDIKKWRKHYSKLKNK